MHEQRGPFNGIDTCNVTSYGNFEVCSKLLNDSESKAIANRPDINALFNKFCNENKITQEFATLVRKFSREFCDDINFDNIFLDQDMFH